MISFKKPAYVAALAAGQAIPHTFLPGFWDHFLFIGGVGSTLPLAFLLMRSRAVHLRTIGRMGVVPGFFNINEPILFGFPIMQQRFTFVQVGLRLTPKKMFMRGIPTIN